MAENSIFQLDLGVKCREQCRGKEAGLNRRRLKSVLVKLQLTEVLLRTLHLHQGQQFIE